jgi:hypothetical protein
LLLFVIPGTPPNDTALRKLRFGVDLKMDAASAVTIVSLARGCLAVLPDSVAKHIRIIIHFEHCVVQPEYRRAQDRHFALERRAIGQTILQGGDGRTPDTCAVSIRCGRGVHRVMLCAHGTDIDRSTSGQHCTAALDTAGCPLVGRMFLFDVVGRARRLRDQAVPIVG